MSNTIFDNKKCPICGEVLAPGKMPVIKSEILSGIYLVGCSNCADVLMNAGSHVVPVPEDRKDLLREYLNVINQKSIERIDKIGLGKTPGGQILKAVLNELAKRNEVENASTEKPATVSKKLAPAAPKATPIFGRPEDFIRIDKHPKAPNEIPFNFAPITKQMQDENDIFIVLSETGNKIAQYEGDKSDAIRNATREFGIEDFAKGNLTLHKLEKVDIKFKEKISYELDM